MEALKQETIDEQHLLDLFFDLISPSLTICQLHRLGSSSISLHSHSIENISWEWRCHQLFGFQLTHSCMCLHDCSHMQLYKRLSALDDLRWEAIGEILPARSGHFSAYLEASSALIIGNGVGKDVTGDGYLNDAEAVESGRLFDVQAVPVPLGTSQEPRAVRYVPEQSRPFVSKWGGTCVAVGGRVYLAGGYEKEPLVVHDYSTDTWQVAHVTGCKLPNRYEQSVVSYQNRLIYFGGKPFEDEAWDSDITELDLTSMRAQKPECSGATPMPRHAHSAGVVGSRMIVIGGFFWQEVDGQEEFCGMFGKETFDDDESQSSSDDNEDLSYANNSYVSLLDLDTYCWSQIASTGDVPVALAYTQVVVVGHKLLAFGGVAGSWSQKIAMLWSLELDSDAVNWTLLDPLGNSPSARYYHTFVLAPPYVLLYGGEDLDEQAISTLHALCL